MTWAPGLCFLNRLLHTGPLAALSGAREPDGPDVWFAGKFDVMTDLPADRGALNAAFVSNGRASFCPRGN